MKAACALLALHGLDFATATDDQVTGALLRATEVDELRRIRFRIEEYLEALNKANKAAKKRYRV